MLPAAEKIEDSTEEELEDTLDKKKRVLEVLRRDPTLLKQFRPILEGTLEEKLESMGVKRGTKGIPDQTYANLREVIRMQQQQKAKKFPDLLALRGKLEQEVKKRVNWSQKSEDDLSLPFSVISATSQRIPHSPLQVTSSKSRVKQVELQPYALETPKPAPRSKSSYIENPKVSSSKPARSSPVSPQHSAVHQPSTSPFSSESEEELSFTSPKVRALKTKPDHPQTAHNEESDWDSSDTESPVGKGTTGKGLAAAGAPSETLVHSLAKNLERTLSAPGRKPVGGVQLFSTPIKEISKPSHSAKHLQSVNEDSDLEISSFEEITQHLDTDSPPKKQHAARGSGDLAGSQGTSTWSSTSTRAGAW